MGRHEGTRGGVGVGRPGQGGGTVDTMGDDGATWGGACLSQEAARGAPALPALPSLDLFLPARLLGACASTAVRRGTQQGRPRGMPRGTPRRSPRGLQCGEDPPVGHRARARALQPLWRRWRRWSRHQGGAWGGWSWWRQRWQRCRRWGWRETRRPTTACCACCPGGSGCPAGPSSACWPPSPDSRNVASRSWSRWSDTVGAGGGRVCLIPWGGSLGPLGRRHLMPWGGGMGARVLMPTRTPGSLCRRDTGRGDTVSAPGGLRAPQPPCAQVSADAVLAAKAAPCGPPPPAPQPAPLWPGHRTPGPAPYRQRSRCPHHCLPGGTWGQMGWETHQGM